MCYEREMGTREELKTQGTHTVTIQHLTSMDKLADGDPDFVIDGTEPPLLTVVIAMLADANQSSLQALVRFMRTHIKVSRVTTRYSCTMLFQ